MKRAGVNERIQVGYVSPGFHRAYGVKPLAGRLLTANDDRAGAEPVALLDHGFWRTHFAGDPGVIGRKLILDDQVWTVAGVMAPFRWHRTAAVFVPIAFGQNKWGLNMREQHSNTGVVAATPGYFRAMGIPLLRGRVFTASDGRRAYLWGLDAAACGNHAGGKLHPSLACQPCRSNGHIAVRLSRERLGNRYHFSDAFKFGARRRGTARTERPDFERRRINQT